MYSGVAAHCIFKENIAGNEGNNTYNTNMPKAILSVYNLTSTYNYDDLFFVNLTTVSGVPIYDANITIRVYENNVFVGSYYCLSGSGWVIDLGFGDYDVVLSVENQAYSVDPVNASFKIIKVGTEIVSDDVVISCGESGGLVATLTNAASGNAICGVNVTVNFNGIDYTLKTNSTGQVSLSIPSNLAPKTYTATISYAGNEAYESSSTTANIVVNTASTVISAYYDRETKEIVATVTNVNTGKGLVTVNVLVNVNGVDYVLRTNSKGQVRLSTNNLTLGIYTVSITYNGNTKYNPSNATIVVNTKYETNISAYYDRETKEIVATLTSGDTGKGLITVNVLINFNGMDYVLKTNSKGQVRLFTGDLALGIYTAVVSYNGNNKYNPSSTTMLINTKYETNISAYYNRETKEIVATLTSGDTGKGLVTVNVFVTVNGVDYVLKTNSKGQVRLSTNNLTPGIYTASITYNGNTKYNPSNVTITVNTKYETNISAYYDRETKEIVATLTNVDTGKGLVTVNVFVTVNGVDYVLKTNSKGQVRLSTNNLTPGIYTASITYNGNTKYNPSNVTITVNTKYETNISAYYDRETKEIVATLTSGDTGKGLVTVNVLINFNGMDYVLRTNSKGQVRLFTGDFAPGIYAASITYNGNTKYNPSNATIAVNTKYETNISAYYDRETKEIVATLTSGDTGKGLVTVNVLVTVNGVDYALKTNSKGQVRLSTNNLTPGIYTVSITYNGNTKYNPSNATITVNTKSDTNISASYDSETKEIVAVVTSGDTGKGLVTVNVLINFNGVDYALKTNSKGQVRLFTGDLAPGIYTATISYKGNAKYNPSSTTVDVIVNPKMNTSISVFYNVGDRELVATLTDDEGEAISDADVVVNIDGMDYVIKTDFKGQAKFSTLYFQPGSYNITFSYGGNDKYNPTSKSARVIIQ